MDPWRFEEIKYILTVLQFDSKARYVKAATYKYDIQDKEINDSVTVDRRKWIKKTCCAIPKQHLTRAGRQLAETYYRKRDWIGAAYECWRGPSPGTAH